MSSKSGIEEVMPALLIAFITVSGIVLFSVALYNDISKGESRQGGSCPCREERVIEGVPGK